MDGYYITDIKKFPGHTELTGMIFTPDQVRKMHDIYRQMEDEKRRFRIDYRAELTSTHENDAEIAARALKERLAPYISKIDQIKGPIETRQVYDDHFRLHTLYNN